MRDVRDEIMSKPKGLLITQVTKTEFRELLAESLDGNLDLDTLCTSDKKRDRIKGRKLFCIINCAAVSRELLLPLIQAEWSWMHFRSAGDGNIWIEVTNERLRRAH